MAITLACQQIKDGCHHHLGRIQLAVHHFNNLQWRSLSWQALVEVIFKGDAMHVFHPHTIPSYVIALARAIWQHSVNLQACRQQEGMLKDIVVTLISVQRDPSARSTF